MLYFLKKIDGSWIILYLEASKSFLEHIHNRNNQKRCTHKSIIEIFPQHLIHIEKLELTFHDEVRDSRCN